MRLKKAQFANQRTASLIKCSANSRSNRARIQAQQQRNSVKQDEKSCVSCFLKNGLQNLFNLSSLRLNLSPFTQIPRFELNFSFLVNLLSTQVAKIFYNLRYF